MDRNSSHREQPPEDKDEGLAKEVGLGAGGTLGSLQPWLLCLDGLYLSHPETFRFCAGRTSQIRYV